MTSRVDRDVERLLEVIESERAALVEGLKGWGRWIARGGGGLGLVDYVMGAPDLDEPHRWRDVGPVPRAEERYKPQGLALVEDELWLTDHHRNRRSHLYRIDPETANVRMEVRMPEEARHPGGLTYDGSHLWAVDYVSARLYRIDPEATRDEGEVRIEASYPTGLPAASALERFETGNRTCFAFSDFLWRQYTIPPVPDGSRRTYLLPEERLPELGKAGVPELSVLSYDNGGYPQGLVWLDGFLLEAVNHHARDWIRVLDVDRALDCGDADEIEREATIPGPASMIEDLATDGTRLWTTDEKTYRLYEHPRPLSGRSGATQASPKEAKEDERR